LLSGAGQSAPRPRLRKAQTLFDKEIKESKRGYSERGCGVAEMLLDADGTPLSGKPNHGSAASVQRLVRKVLAVLKIVQDDVT
jgi:hypothetical protein